MRRALLVFAGATLLVTGLSAQVAPQRWGLLYSGGPQRPNYGPSDLASFVGIVDTAGKPRGWLFTGVVVLDFHAFSGRYYMPMVSGTPADGNDWSAYLDTVFQAGGVLRHLDSAVALVGATINDSGRHLDLGLMLPYPDARVESIHFSGRSYDQGELVGRADAVGAFLTDAEARFRRAAFKHLSLTAFYWLDEGAPGTDSSLIKLVAAKVHQANMRFLWIPSFGATNAANWRDMGFDDAWLQPNYFFHPDVPQTRLDSAIAFARKYSMGMELEFDRRLFLSWRFADRLEPYLAAFENTPDLRDRSIAVYEGGGALINLAHSRDAWHRALYARLVQLLAPPAAGTPGSSSGGE